MANTPSTTQALVGFPPLVLNVPPNYPTTPKVGKISLLFNANSTNLYHKFSPFTKRDNPFGLFGPLQEPFIYRYIDDAQAQKRSTLNNLPVGVDIAAAVVGLPPSFVNDNINQDTVDDVVRVSKFLTSPPGVLYNVNQLVIQRMNAFDETRIYNPFSPVLAAIQPLTLGLGNPPTRHIEGGILGLVSSLTSVIGINLQNGFQTPSSTVGDGALSDFNGGEGKGLVRGADASKGFAQVQTNWANSTGTNNILTMFRNAAVQLFGGPQKQPTGTIFRADESTYTLMASSLRLSPTQMWYPSSQTRADQPIRPPSLLATINNVSSTVLNAITNPTSLIGLGLSALFPSAGQPNGANFKRTKLISLPNRFLALNASNLTGRTINGQSTGYSITDGDKYGNDVGIAPVGSFTNSDMLVQYSFYLDSTQQFKSKFSDPSSTIVQSINDSLKAAINDINNKSGGRYQVLTDTYSRIVSSGQITNPSQAGYNRIASISVQPGASKKSYGVTAEYASKSSVPRTVDISTSNNTMRLATSFVSDGINQLPVIRGDRTFKPDADLAAMYPGWTKWEPDKDDLVKFFFYDVVNDKYLPFRATMKGISEGNTAFWDELRFIGRADQLYSYNGFSRTLTFTFNIVINSISELLPTWKKINYLAGAVKPSNYTASDKFNNVFSKFIVPPMFMITIGDLYNFQPMVITSISINIPDDASWETLNEANSSKWTFLNGIISAPNVGKKYAQVPREVEIAVTANLLEKERAIVGAAHFGHAPHTDDYVDGTYNTGSGAGGPVPFLPVPTEFSTDMIEYNPLGSTQPVTTNTDPFLSTNSPPKSPVSKAPTSNPTSAGVSGFSPNTPQTNALTEDKIIELLQARTPNPNPLSVQFQPPIPR